MTKTRRQYISNTVKAWGWLAFGVYGLIEFVHWVPKNPVLDTVIAASIPVLFFISVYANAGAHFGLARTAKQDEDNNLESIEDKLDQVLEKLGEQT